MFEVWIDVPIRLSYRHNVWCKFHADQMWQNGPDSKLKRLCQLSVIPIRNHVSLLTHLTPQWIVRWSVQKYNSTHVTKLMDLIVSNRNRIKWVLIPPRWRLSLFINIFILYIHTYLSILAYRYLEIWCNLLASRVPHYLMPSIYYVI